MPEAKLDAADIAAVRDLAVKAAGNLRSATVAAPVGAVGVPAELPILIREGAEPGAISLRDLFEKYRRAPERRAGVAKVTTLASFVDLVQRHKDEGSVIFAQTAWPEPKLTAVIDYHTIAHEARFGAHRIEYAFPLTAEFNVWIKGAGKPMEQADFAAFLEDHAAELAAPFDAERTDYEPLFKERFATPAELISLSRSLEVFVGAKVKRAERLQTGERTVEFVEQHTNGAGEKVDIPGVFMVAVPAFIDGEKLRIPARLRYRIAGGSIVWLYELYRWEFWLRAQVQNDLAAAARDTALPAFEGAPEN